MVSLGAFEQLPLYDFILGEKDSREFGRARVCKEDFYETRDGFFSLS